MNEENVKSAFISFMRSPIGSRTIEALENEIRQASMANEGVFLAEVKDIANRVKGFKPAGNTYVFYFKGVFLDDVRLIFRSGGFVTCYIGRYKIYSASIRHLKSFELLFAD